MFWVDSLRNHITARKNIVLGMQIANWNKSELSNSITEQCELTY